MTTLYFGLKWLHIVSSTVLLGTGAGIAFFFLRVQRTGDVRIIAAVADDVVMADALFTAVAVVVQPVTGLTLARLAGYPWQSHWLMWSIGLYFLIGCCWLPVVGLQLRMRDLAKRAAATATALPPEYQRYFRLWCLLGWPAFLGVMAIFYLMIAKPG